MSVAELQELEEIKGLVNRGQQLGVLTFAEIAGAVSELDLGPLQESVQLLDVCLVEIELRYRPGNLGIREDAELLSAVDEALDLFEFLQFRY